MSENTLEFHGNQIEQLDHQMPGRDDSLIRSTSQSHQGVSRMSKNTLTEQQTLAQSGDFSRYREQEAVHMRSVLSAGKAEGALPSSQVDYSQFIHHPEMVGLAPSARILLPLEPAAEPIYVNPKQYDAIVRRRQKKAKLEAKNKTVKTRKPYLHESRHLHALKRERGSGGRFLNKKKQQQQQQQEEEEEDPSASANSNPFTETPNSSDITTVSVCASGGLSNPLQEHRSSFSSPGFNSHAGGNIYGGNNHGLSGGGR